MKNNLLKVFISALNILVLGLIIFLAWHSICDKGNLPLVPPHTSNLKFAIGDLFWNARIFDVLGQAVILFCCILGIILLFRTEESK